MSNRMSYLLAVLVLLLAAGLRMWQLTTLQPGLNTDEIITLQIIDRVQTGGITVFHDMGEVGGREGFYEIIVWLVSLFTGEGLPGYRMFGVWLSLITLAFTYSLGVRLFGRVAGLAAMTLHSLLMLDIVLARVLIPESLMVLIITATMLALARALPVYRDSRIDSSNTISFAALGILPALGLYVHPTGLLLVLVCAVFIAYILLFHQRTARSRAGYIGFALLVFMTLSIPYLTSSINRPTLAAGMRLLNLPENIFAAFTDTLFAFVFQGDTSALYNFAGRPLLDLVSGFFVLTGIVIIIRSWRYPRYALPLMAGFFFLLYVVFSETPAAFSRFMVFVPVVVLFFGVSVQTLGRAMPTRTRRFAVIGLYLLLAFNLFWTGRDLFLHWTAQTDIPVLYHHREGLLTQHMDRTVHEIPTVICDTTLADMRSLEPAPDNGDIDSLELTLRLMNRKNPDIRRIDCRNAYLFVDGINPEQLILPDAAVFEQMPPVIQTWLAEFEDLETQGLLPGSAYLMTAPDYMERNLGKIERESTVRYPERMDGEFPVVSPPVQMGNNLTFLGYEVDEKAVYVPGDVVRVVQYWRVAGELPSGLTLFVHLLSDPVTIAAQRARTSVFPPELNDRDIFIQVTDVQLPETMLPGDYTVSVLAESMPGVRVPVLQTDYDIEVDRLFLYPVTVISPKQEE